MNKNKRYAFYIDDSGTKEYAESFSDYGVTGNSRYFVFGGVLISTVESGLLADHVKRLKKAYFGNENVEIKSNWLRIPKESERRYKQKFGMTDESLKEFVEHYYAAIAAADLRLFAAVVDKIHVQEDYTKPWYAPAIAYEVLMQRIVQEVRPPETVSVIIDDMTGATPKGHQYRANLKAHHEKLRKFGSPLWKGLNFEPVLPGIRFVDSAVSHIIQVADVISYNVYRQFVNFGEFWETGKTDQDGNITLPTYEWLGYIENKFCQGPKGRVQGYGLVKFPLRKRIPWAVDPKGK